MDPKTDMGPLARKVLFKIIINVFIGFTKDIRIVNRINQENWI